MSDDIDERWRENTLVRFFTARLGQAHSKAGGIVATALLFMPISNVQIILHDDRLSEDTHSKAKVWGTGYYKAPLLRYWSTN